MDVDQWGDDECWNQHVGDIEFEKWSRMGQIWIGGTDEGLRHEIVGIDVRGVDRQRAMFFREKWTSKTGLAARCAEIEVGVQWGIGDRGDLGKIIRSVDGISIVVIDVEG